MELLIVMKLSVRKRGIFLPNMLFFDKHEWASPTCSRQGALTDVRMSQKTKVRTLPQPSLRANDMLYRAANHIKPHCGGLAYNKFNKNNVLGAKIFALSKNGNYTV